MFEEVDAEEYEKIRKERINNDFIVDDEGYGYKDDGAEVWEYEEDEQGNKKKKKQRKLNVSNLVKRVSVERRTVDPKLYVPYKCSLAEASQSGNKACSESR